MRANSVIILSLLLFSSCFRPEDYSIDITYTGENLRFISYPLGGIGTGNILMDGYGSIREFEVFNRPAYDELPPDMTFFSLYTKSEGSPALARIMEREGLNEYPNPFGKPRQQLGGLPRFREAKLHNAYPLITMDLQDEAVPLEVKLVAWSPFIPVDHANSSLPAAIIEWKLSNPGSDPVGYSVAFSMGNPFRPGENNGAYSDNGSYASVHNQDGYGGITFNSPVSDSLRPGAGSVRVSIPGEEIRPVFFEAEAWWDGAEQFWRDFSDDGILDGGSALTGTPVPGCSSAVLIMQGSLAAGESVNLPFLFTWHIPVRKLEDSQSLGNEKVRGAEIRNHYSTRYKTIDEVSSYLTSNLDMLRSKTALFSTAMITSSVPVPVLDAAISNMASLKTNLLMMDGDGNLHGFEGLGNDFGCCPGNCTHVWNYAQTMAALFPSLEQNVRETGFLHSTFENGYQCFRTVFPLSDSRFRNVAADGQMGNIIRVYREWKMSGDTEWLGSLWPAVKKSLEFAWEGSGDLVNRYAWMKNGSIPWDPNREGVLRGEQHTTYDINFYGPNMLTGSLYLGALKACSEMALAMNEPQKAVEYNAIYRKGAGNYVDLLWNGAYFTQQVEVPAGFDLSEHYVSNPFGTGALSPKYQAGEGCLSDQLLGQYLAFVSGMGYLLDTTLIRTALRSVYQYNFREELRVLDNVQRIYAANDESGLLTCTWPRGDRPPVPFVYSDEVWTGIEYQAAASMIWADLVKEGLTVTEAVRKRYNGSNRNPFAEIESGRYYARALASWSVYQAMAGYNYDGTKCSMKFSPAVDQLPQRFFWSSEGGWGTLSVSRSGVELKCLHGNLKLKELVLEGKSFFVLQDHIPTHELEMIYKGEALHMNFKHELQLMEGENFKLELP